MLSALSTPRRPAIFVLENVKNLKSHDGGKTFRIIMQTLDELGYDVADAQHMGADDPKIIDGKHFLPQHRERIVLVGFRRDLNLKGDFTAGYSLFILRVAQPWPTCWNLSSTRNYPHPGAVEIPLPLCEKTPAKGNGFGFGDG